VQSIIKKLNSSKKPLIYFGAALKLNKKLINLIQTFCEKQNIPFVSSWFGKGIFDDYHPLSLGSYNGVFSDFENRKYIENEVDYVIEIATSIFNMDANMAFDTGTHKLSTFSNKSLLKGTSKLQKDLIEIFEKLLNSDCKTFEYNFEKKKSEEVVKSEKLDFHNLTTVLNSIQDKSENSMIYLPEVGNSYFASYSLKTRKSSLGRGWLCNAWYGAMGTSLPYARAVCEVLKNSKSNDIAVVITGDGGFHFQLNELIHFMKDDLNLTIIYMRNNIFHLGKNSNAKIYNCSTPDFDVQKLITCYGGEAKICSNVNEFSNYFSQCITENKGIKLIEVPVIPEPQFQCNEIKLLNTYISSKNGIPEAVDKWNEIINGK
jgi:thiamine pyrophosphate-dependent acetolactate synthase large subunit-like protein